MEFVSEEKKLEELIQSRQPNGEYNRQYIDNIIPASLLHEYDPKTVLHVAVTLGFRVQQCRREDGVYKANGVWIPNATSFEPRLPTYNNVECNGLCKDCVSYALSELKNERKEHH